MRFKKILTTGGCGFMGSAFIRYGFSHFPLLEKLVNVDLLTYAANTNSTKSVSADPRYVFVQGDICSQSLIQTLCETHQIEAIVHFAAESHVDRSILSPEPFIHTNIQGTFSLLEVVRRLPHLHFHHISTDEVYGSLSLGHFQETSPYQPSSPYAASKAASDHLVRSFGHTYRLSYTLSHSSNNYGPFQYPEKFIPRMILGCLHNQPLPLYGKGDQVRDWLYVYDHAEAIWTILEKGRAQETYNIGGSCEKRNIDLLQEIVLELSEKTKKNPSDFFSLVKEETDRPGHDFRYALDCSKIKLELGWQQKHSFPVGLKKTIEWYLNSSFI